MDCGGIFGTQYPRHRERGKNHRRHDCHLMLIFPKTINADGLLPFLGQLAERADASE